LPTTILLHDAIYSGGLDIKDNAWGRIGDYIGVGYAYLNGGNINIQSSQVTETFYRWQLGEAFALTAVIQYQHDEYKNNGRQRLDTGFKGCCQVLKSISK